MKGYAHNNVFTIGQLRALDLAIEYVHKLPETYEDKPLRCHEVARLVKMRLEQFRAEHRTAVHLVDGKYGIAEHSWLVFEPRHVKRPFVPDMKSYNSTGLALLDPYVLARLPLVQLVHCYFDFANLYHPGEYRDDIDDALIEEIWNKT